MHHKATFRVLIFDDDEAIRKILWQFFDHKGYEVFTFPHPRSCPICEISKCTCPITASCADFIITDLDMPFMKGIDFIEQQVSKGCKVKNIALMSGGLNGPVVTKAEELGVKVFPKPFKIADMERWIREAEAKIPQDRELSDWHL